MCSPILPLFLLFLSLAAPTAAAQSDLPILLDLRAALGITNSTPGFQSWSSSTPPCSFAGVTCDPNGSVTKIDLAGRGISGTLPFDSLCRLPALANLTLRSNHLHGNLTPSLRSCTGLIHLDLSFNNLTGTVPDFSPLNKLQVLKLNDNDFSGPFPWSALGNLTGLGYLSLGDNPFDIAPFPEVIVNLTHLYYVFLSDTNIKGEIPPSIGDLTELIDLELADNLLTGEIPPEIVKLKKLQQLEIYNNSLTGKIPNGFGNLSDLAFFDASMNQLEGDLSELRFLTKLISLQLFFNDFSGEIPAEFGEFKNLVNLSLFSNRLTGALPAKLGSWADFNFIDVSTNFLTGEIPPDMCRQGTMKKLLLLENQFTGEIPASYGNCSTLTRFRVSNNSLSGVVPAGIWSLPKVNIIDLAINQFEGPIGAGIGEAKSLYQLYIAGNRFSGEIPPEIAGATALVTVDAGFNRFSGQIPATVGELKYLVNLDLEGNGLSGEIPDSIGTCVSLNTVNLSNNSLTGGIPAILGNLPSLNSLDLSDNQLSGSIPASLSSLKLSQLDLSNNRLAGGIPAVLSIDAYNMSFAGNPGLCADNIHYLSRCSSPHSRSSDKIRTILTVLLATFAVALSASAVFIVVRRYRSDGRIDGIRSKDSTWDLKSFRVLSFDENEVIGAVKLENLIGKGGSGNVYRVALSTGQELAVKHIWNSPDPATPAFSGGASAKLTRRSSSVRSREFEAEVNTLSSIRHVNVVKLYCSITSEDSSLLVYEYLPNGSLWDRLHEAAGAKLGGLDWEARYEVAVGAARGLEYLHHGCDRPILHRDVKSSNILLDEFFKPRIADFGLAKILHSAAAGRDSSATHVIAGTHGYIAPEYAYTWKVNEKSDVYSFGVVLMELVTGRRPIEPEYGDNKDIVYWISGEVVSRESVVSVVDKRIPESYVEEAVKVLRVGVLCTARLPAMRPSMRSVVQLLEEAAADRHNLDQFYYNKVESKASSFDKVNTYKLQRTVSSTKP